MILRYHPQQHVLYLLISHTVPFVTSLLTNVEFVVVFWAVFVGFFPVCFVLFFLSKPVCYLFEMIPRVYLHFSQHILSQAWHLRALGSLREQPITVHDSNYVSTIYEKKAICACFGACRLPTNGAVLPIPALSAFTLPIFTSPVLRAAGVAHTLVTARSCPALLAATRPAHAHAVGAAVHGAHF